MGLLDGISENEEVSFERMDAELQRELGAVGPDTAPIQPVQIPTQPVVVEQYDVEQAQEVTAELSEVEKRLAKAQLYKQFITGDIFSGAENDPTVQEVSREFQDFARQQLQVLMGLAQPAKQESSLGQFTEEELGVLKVFIARIIKNSTKPVVTKPAQTKPAQTKPTAPAQPKPQTVKPAPIAQAKPAKPTLQKREVPEEAIPRISSLDKIPQTPKRTTAAPVRTPQRHTVFVPFPANLLPADGAIIEENGQQAKVKYGDLVSVDEYGLMDGARIRKLQDGYAITLSNDVQVANIGGRLVKLTKTFVPSQAPVPGRLPTPTPAQLEIITATQAQATFNAIGNTPIIAPPSLNSMLGR